MKKMSFNELVGYFFSFFSFFFLGPFLRRKEVPRLRVDSELQLLAYTTATPDPRGHARSFHLLVRPGIQPASSWIAVEFLTCRATTGPLLLFFL